MNLPEEKGEDGRDGEQSRYLYLDLNLDLHLNCLVRREGPALYWSFDTSPLMERRVDIIFVMGLLIEENIGINRGLPVFFDGWSRRGSE